MNVWSVSLCVLAASIPLALGSGGVSEPPSSARIEGVVVDADGPRHDALVRVQTTERSTTSDAAGRFDIDVSGLGQGPFEMTAWAEGFFCSGPVSADAGEAGVVIRLIPHHDGDHAEYQWLSAESDTGMGEDQACKTCHSRGNDLPFRLPVDQWRLDAHSASAVNPRFLTMYLGTDVKGRASPPTRQFPDPEYGTLPLPPDSSQDFFGPGYKLDFPDSAGNCATCHVPLAAIDAPYETDPTTATGAAAEGVTCDFCHKIGDVVIDPETNLPYPDRPGVMSFRFRRPPEGHQYFAGPFDDVAPGEDTYSPLQRESLICAPCHFATFWGTEIYGSYREWLESPYSDPETGQTCQDCHMPASGAEYFARPDKGGLRRGATSLHSHYMPGAADETLLRNAVSMEVDTRWVESTVIVSVRITNNGAGHHVPTDSPLRHLILIVQAKGHSNEPLEIVEGQVVPVWGGVGDPVDGNYAGLPGTAFAKVLVEEWTKITPTGAYWNPTKILSDNRIPALGEDRSTYRFAAADHKNVFVEATLIFRRAFKDIADQKGWSDPDIVIETRTIELRPGRQQVIASTPPAGETP